MTTADYALIVSLLSVAISLVGLGWNVWSKFIYPKARLRLSFYTATIIRGGDIPRQRPRFLCASVTNFGPTDVIVRSFNIFEREHFWQKPQHAFVNPIHDINMPDLPMGPFAGGLPKKLEVGGEFSLYFPFEAQSFARQHLTAAGVYDSFGRYHRCPRKQIKKVQADLDEAFGPKANPTGPVD